MGLNLVDEKIAKKTECPFIMYVPMSWCKNIILHRVSNRLIKENIKSFFIPFVFLILFIIVSGCSFFTYNLHRNSEEKKLSAISSKIDTHAEGMSTIISLNSIGTLFRKVSPGDQLKLITKLCMESGVLTRKLVFTQNKNSIPANVRANLENTSGKNIEDISIEGIWIAQGVMLNGEGFNNNFISSRNEILTGVLKNFPVKGFVDIANTDGKEAEIVFVFRKEGGKK